MVYSIEEREELRADGEADAEVSKDPPRYPVPPAFWYLVPCLPVLVRLLLRNGLFGRRKRN
jgi:hypothetical protein